MGPPPFYQAGHDMGVESDTYAVGSMTMSHFLRVNFNLKSAILDFLLVIFNLKSAMDLCQTSRKAATALDFTPVRN